METPLVWSSASGVPVVFQAEARRGLPHFELNAPQVPATARREHLSRVRAALERAQFPVPAHRAVVIDVQPSDGAALPPSVDLAVAVAVLAGLGGCPAAAVAPWLFVAGLAPDYSGRLVGVGDLAAHAAVARARGLRGLVLAADDAPLAARVQGFDDLAVRVAATLREVVEFLADGRALPAVALGGDAPAGAELAPLRAVQIDHPATGPLGLALLPDGHAHLYRWGGADAQWAPMGPPVPVAQLGSHPLLPPEVWAALLAELPRAELFLVDAGLEARLGLPHGARCDGPEVEALRAALADPAWDSVSPVVTGHDGTCQQFAEARDANALLEPAAQAAVAALAAAGIVARLHDVRGRGLVHHKIAGATPAALLARGEGVLFRPATPDEIHPLVPFYALGKTARGKHDALIPVFVAGRGQRGGKTVREVTLDDRLGGPDYRDEHGKDTRRVSPKKLYVRLLPSGESAQEGGPGYRSLHLARFVTRAPDAAPPARPKSPRPKAPPKAAPTSADPATLPRPFASKAHDDGTADLGGCCLCGRPTPGPQFFVELAHGGAIVRPGTADKNDPGYMGLYPVGPECRKKLPAGYVVEAGAATAAPSDVYVLLNAGIDGRFGQVAVADHADVAVEGLGTYGRGLALEVGGALGRALGRAAGARVTVTPPRAPLEQPYTVGLGLLVAALAHHGLVPREAAAAWGYVGTLSLDARAADTLTWCGGALPAVLAYARGGIPRVIVGAPNGVECAALAGIDVRVARTVAEVVAFLRGAQDLPPATNQWGRDPEDLALDPIGLRVPAAVASLLTVAAAGRHGFVLAHTAATTRRVGELLRVFLGLLPDLGTAEGMDLAAIRSVASLAAEGTRRGTRPPFRAPHFTVSPDGLRGQGGRPGEVSLAHGGVLALDKVYDFHPLALRDLDGVLRDGVDRQVREGHAVEFPARALPALTTLYCPCGKNTPFFGYMGHLERERYGDVRQECTCTWEKVQKFYARTPAWAQTLAPILVPVPDAGHDAWSAQWTTWREPEDIAFDRGLIRHVRALQAERRAPPPWSDEATRILRSAATHEGWSAARTEAVAAVARTYADLETARLDLARRRPEKRPPFDSSAVATAVSACRGLPRLVIL